MKRSMERVCLVHHQQVWKDVVCRNHSLLFCQENQENINNGKLTSISFYRTFIIWFWWNFACKIFIYRDSAYFFLIFNLNFVHFVINVQFYPIIQFAFIFISFFFSIIVQLRYFAQFYSFFLVFFNLEFRRFCRF